MIVEEHAYRTIGKDLKSGNIPPVVILCGVEDYLVEFYLKSLIRKYVNKACEALDLVELDRDSMTTGEITECLETVPVMSERKVVIIKDFINSKGNLPKAYQEKSGKENRELKSLLEYIDGLRSNDEEIPSLLIFTVSPQEEDRNEKAVKQHKLFKAVGKSGKVYDFQTLDRRTAASFIEKRIKAAGKICKPQLISGLINESGYSSKDVDYNLYSLGNDIDKIIAHCGDSPEISEEDLRAGMAENPENNVFAMIEAISNNRKDRALELLNNLLEDRESEFMILALLVKQLELMLMTSEMRDEGKSLKAIQAELKRDKVNEYRTEKAYKAGRRFSKDDLKKILSMAYEIEINIKSGLMPARLALECFIAGI